MTEPEVRLVISDVDGTLVTSDKVLVPSAIAAVAKLRERGIHFAITSGRPPRGMAMLVDPLELTTPISGFNGGLVVEPDLSVLEQRTLPTALVEPIMELLGDFSLDVWMYQGTDWFVLDPEGAHVQRETMTCQFAPTTLGSFDDVRDGVVKVVGVSDDHDAVAAAGVAARERFGQGVSATASQPYYLDVTHPDANKGCVVKYIAGSLGIPTEAIATIGDMANDVLMFAHSGRSIAMGNASSEVHKAARFVTKSNDDEGFAYAVERFILSA